MGLDDLAGRLDAAGDELAGASTTMALADPGSRAFGGDAPGAPGELGRALHRTLTTALTARAREASAHGIRLSETAEALRRAAQDYRTVDDDARHRHQRQEDT
ncbi:hypothetical protein Daura_02870 [Dactylosporangium aurantiacum]|uniref:Uncharacterized protein n=1 Tax=Dactylosporangium aurantiacum TaxID=35754 RepID=A0A9Q9ILR0_9ACTN|nr:hypothetical protein [Dactylosporangium aurantiacum]MDG6100695.1 hypothetical protein [Dactylosporangium aurantiacum]UWZ55230.1 hypothetical protein Daura_02870 [Dactylosporangium aurantiacum]